jgi:hypothetical protein
LKWEQNFVPGYDCCVTVVNNMVMVTMIMVNSRADWAVVGAHTRGVFEANKQLQDKDEIRM